MNRSQWTHSLNVWKKPLLNVNRQLCQCLLVGLTFHSHYYFQSFISLQWSFSACTFIQTNILSNSSSTAIILSFQFSMSWKMPESVFNVKILLLSFPLGHLYPLTTTVLIYVNKRASTEILSLVWHQCQHSLVSYLLYNSTDFHLKSPKLFCYSKSFCHGICNSKV